MKEFFGTYLGASPTDESNSGRGEIEITFDEEGIKMRFATGLKVEEDALTTAQLIPMTEEEIKEEYIFGSSFPLRTVGLRTPHGFPKFLFLKDPQRDESGLVVRMGEMSELFGPTWLFSPAQVASGAFDRLLEVITACTGKGMFPRLAHGGKA